MLAVPELLLGAHQPPRVLLPDSHALQPLLNAGQAGGRLQLAAVAGARLLERRDGSRDEMRREQVGPQLTQVAGEAPQ